MALGRPLLLCGMVMEPYGMVMHHKHQSFRICGLISTGSREEMIVSFIRFFSVAQHWIRLVYSNNCHKLWSLFLLVRNIDYVLTMLNTSHVPAFLINTRVSLKNVFLLMLSDQRFSDFFPVKGTATRF